MFTDFIVNQIKRRGYEIYKTGVSDRVATAYRKTISHFQIDYLIDVGANEGQFAAGMRMLGYDGYMSSFEPLTNSFKKLRENSAGDSKWFTFNMALGNADMFTEINVSKNTVSSSLLEILPEHVRQEPDSAIVGKEKIEVKKLDTIFDELPKRSERVFLKIDVQGFEKFVLEGAKDSFENIRLIQLELSLVPLYKGELLLAEMIGYMDGLGYKLYNLLPGFNNIETAQLIQADGIFARTDLMK